MQKYSDVVASSGADSVLRPVEGATVTVNVYNGSAATIYSDNGVTTQANPIVTDSNGRFSFYAADGRYSLTIAKTGITTYTISDILLEDSVNDVTVTPQDFMSDSQRSDVSAETLLLDVSGAIQTAITSGNVRIPKGKYLIGSSISIPSNRVIYSDGATLYAKNSLNSQIFTIADSATNVEISGLIFNGNKANNTSGSGIFSGAVGIDNIRINGNTFFNFAEDGIAIGESNNISICANLAYGCEDGGITLKNTCENFTLENNRAYSNGTHGVGITGIGKYGVISGNNCWDNGQGTPNADNLTGYNSSNTGITISNNSSYGGLNNGIHFGGSNITYSGNVVIGAAKNGIIHSPNTGTDSNVTITGNNITSCGLQGIRVLNANLVSVSGNNSVSNTTAGCGIDTCNDVVVSDNVFKSNTTQGLNFGNGSTRVTVSANHISNNGNVGIDLYGSSYCVISSNVIMTNTGAATAGGSDSNNTICNNIIRNNVGGGILGLSTTTKIYGNDTGSGQTFIISAPSGSDAFVIQNNSTASFRGWEFYNVTNGTDTDLRLYEYAGSAGDRAIFKSGGDILWNGNQSVNTAGKGLRVKEGSNAKQGTAVLVAGSVTVANTSVTANSRIFLTSNADGGTPGFLRVSARVAATSFTITSSNGADTSTVAYQIFEPA